MELPPFLSGEASESFQMSSAESAAPSLISMKSDRSKELPPFLSGEASESFQMSSAESAAPSLISMKSDRSKELPPFLSGEASESKLTRELSSCPVCGEDLRDPVSFACGHQSCRKCVSSDWDQSGSPENYACPECGKKCRKDPKYRENTDKDTGKCNC
ncbi:uncharacterized protein LOC144538312 [Centroberyx gerrardi]